MGTCVRLCRRGPALVRTDGRFFVGLRLMASGRPCPGEWQQTIRRFVDAGLLVTEDGILRLTSRGMLLSNEAFQEFLTS